MVKLLRNVNRLKFIESLGKLPIILWNLWSLTQIDKEKPEDHTMMSPVQLGNTRILIDYAQNFPQTVLYLGILNLKTWPCFWKILFSHLFWLDSHLFCRSDFKQIKFECVFLSDLHIYHSNIHVQLRRVTTKGPYTFINRNIPYCQANQMVFW